MKRGILIICILLFSLSSISFAKSFNIIFNNESNNSRVKHVYLVIKGEVNGRTCFIRITKLANPNDSLVSPCETVTTLTKPSDYAFDAVANVSFRVPPLSSGRMYISINKPLIMHINNNATVAEPSVSDSNLSSNPDYKTLFDKVEFTYNENGKTFFNPTAVDFVSLPISISQHNHVFGLTSDRETVLLKMQETFKEELNTHEYQHLIIKDNNLILRILAPGHDRHIFDENYLTPYIDWLFNDYYFSRNGYTANHILSLQLVEASGVIPQKPRILTLDEGIFRGFVKFNNNEKAFVLSNILGDTITIKRSSFTSNGLFSAAMGEITVDISPKVRERIARLLDDPSQFEATVTRLMNGYKAVAVKYISSAWAVGLLPAPNDETIDQNYIRHQIGTDPHNIYKERFTLPATLQNRGPWYQLYGKALHLLTSHLYAFPYDDVLGLDGTNAENDSYPATVTLHSLTNTEV